MLRIKSSKWWTQKSVQKLWTEGERNCFPLPFTSKYTSSQAFWFDSLPSSANRETLSLQFRLKVMFWFSRSFPCLKSYIRSATLLWRKEISIFTLLKITEEYEARHITAYWVLPDLRRREHMINITLHARTQFCVDRKNGTIGGPYVICSTDVDLYVSTFLTSLFGISFITRVENRLLVGSRFAQRKITLKYDSLYFLFLTVQDRMEADVFDTYLPPHTFSLHDFLFSHQSPQQTSYYWYSGSRCRSSLQYRC